MTQQSITIPVSPNNRDEQLQALVMALIHAYSLSDVLGCMHEGLLTHYDLARTDYKVQGPILDSINVAWTLANLLLKEGESDDTSN